MDVLSSQTRTDSKEFGANRDRMIALVEDLRARLARAREGGGAKYLERHRQLGKLPVRDRIAQLVDANTPFLELSALAATDMYENEEEERFWRAVRLEPARTARDITRRFQDLERRLRAAEARVTSSEFKLRRQFRDLEG